MDILELIRTKRFQNSGLIKKFPTVEQCVYELIGVQSQYFNHAALVICSRVANEKKIEDLYSSLDNNQIIDIWGQRSTLHFYHIKDWGKIINSFGQTKCWVKNFCERNSFNYDEELERLSILFKRHKILTIEQIIELGVEPVLVKNWGGLLIPLSLQGQIYINRYDPLKPKHYCSRNLISGEPFESNSNSLRDILKRYFSTYGPATYLDFLHWSGLQFKDIKNELKWLHNEFDTYVYDGQVYYYDISDDMLKYDSHKVHLLPKFDPLLVAYKNKSILIDDVYHSLVWKKAGQIEACIFDGNKFIGTWRYLTKGINLVFYITVYSNVTSRLKREISDKCLEYAKYMNKNLNRVIFE